MNFKSLCVLAITMLFGLWCWNYYTCEIKGFCTEEKLASKANPESIAPIQFFKNSNQYKLNQFDSYADSIINLAKTKKLDIIGYYTGDEHNTSSFPNLGIARAMALRDLLISKGLDTNTASILGLKRNAEFTDSLAVLSSIDTSMQVQSNSSDVQLITHHGITEIYFPTNSDSEIKSPALDSFLANTARSSTGKKIWLNGHTDNTGIEEENIKLSLKRSEAIKSKLIGFGIASESIICEGKGSSLPKVSNTSPENRALNRRVEVVVE